MKLCSTDSTTHIIYFFLCHFNRCLPRYLFILNSKFNDINLFIYFPYYLLNIFGSVLMNSFYAQVDICVFYFFLIRLAKGLSISLIISRNTVYFFSIELFSMLIFILCSVCSSFTRYLYREHKLLILNLSPFEVPHQSLQLG